jgi:hypothetical protein
MLWAPKWTERPIEKLQILPTIHLPNQYAHANRQEALSDGNNSGDVLGLW